LCISIKQHEVASSVNKASNLLGSPLHCVLTGRGALAVGLDEAPWRRYAHKDRGNDHYNVGTDRWSLTMTT
jgi:hypothetical protein